MDKYNVTGMSCSACSASVEKAVKKVKGIDSCTVSLLTNSMTVEGHADPKAVIEAVRKSRIWSQSDDRRRPEGCREEAGSGCR